MVSRDSILSLYCCELAYSILACLTIDQLSTAQEKVWNLVEISLLTVGLTMTGLTTTLIANDLHWSDSKITTLLTILVIFVASLICGAMALLATRLGKPLGFLSFFGYDVGTS